MSSSPLLPDLSYETELWAGGYHRIAGLDEAGRGAWAGPVVAAAVILPPDDPHLLQHLDGVQDCKQLSPATRERLLPIVVRHALAWVVGAVPPEVIDAVGIVPATRQAMTLALGSLAEAADYLLIDHLLLPEVALPQQGITHGDGRVLSIAAASIVAKVSRDRMMVELDGRFPGYGLAQHKGYGTPGHRAALAARGPCAVHRMSFAPLRELLDAGAATSASVNEG